MLVIDLNHCVNTSVKRLIKEGKTIMIFGKYRIESSLQCLRGPSIRSRPDEDIW